MHRIPMQAEEVVAIAPGEGGYTGRLFNCSLIIASIGGLLVPIHVLPEPRSEELLQFICALSLLSNLEQPLLSWQDVFALHEGIVDAICCFGRQADMFRTELRAISRSEPLISVLDSTIALDAGSVNSTPQFTDRPISILFFNDAANPGRLDSISVHVPPVSVER